MNCKPGDLAYVVGSSEPGQNGMVVEVVCVGNHGSPWWHVKFRGSVVTVRGSIAHGAAQVRDEYLRPISGVPLTDEVHDEVTA